MGFDVYGKSPTDVVGEYFRNSVWGWHPLAQYCEHVAPEITQHCHYWHSNDGDGLDAENSKALAQVLQDEINSGRTQDYVDARKAKLDAMPDLPCTWCGGTGVRTDACGVENKMPERDNPHTGKKGWCNGCDGKGGVRPFEANYDLDVENVREFAEFLSHCGGFEIC